jgi:hypothetical protein
MAFSQRQINEIQPLAEVSACVASPGAVGNGTTVYVTAACTIGGTSGPAATFAIGDWLQVYPASTAGTNGISVTAAPTATAGTVGLYFQNNTGGSITPVASSAYKIVAYRTTPTIIS